MFAARWDPCVAHFGQKANVFIQDYFFRDDVRPLLVAGAGFDPRSQIVAKLVKGANATLYLIKERRPSPDSIQISQAETNTLSLLDSFPNSALLPIQIFGDDNAVIGGRNVVNALNEQPFDSITDVIVDISALSVGTSFPIIRYFAERCRREEGPENLHVCVTHDPALDMDIKSVASDSISYAHGFRGEITLEASSEKAKMWLPQLSMGRKSALSRLYGSIEPDDTCPIVPFPASDPRIADKLFADYQEELESTWEVDTRNIVFADEADPVDLYRTILRLDDLRKPVFESYGGSHLVLSPLGSKVMALGALMAALERNLPVAYLEAETYQLGARAKAPCINADIAHVWLEGRAYPSGRPHLFSLDRPLS